VLYGVYLSLHYGYITSKAYSRLATQVKAVIWIVFTLLLMYEILAFGDNFRWMGEFRLIPILRYRRCSYSPLTFRSLPAHLSLPPRLVTLDRTQEDIILGTWVDFITSFVAGSVAVVVQVFLTVRASVVSPTSLSIGVVTDRILQQLIRQRWMQLTFLIVMGIAILASFTGAILTTATSFMVRFTCLSLPSLRRLD